ncbi:hypothetical protein KKD03_05075 [Patescibacteria group bacterium]|nr:hypothetical protein [Patescibacteria group bacterium]
MVEKFSRELIMATASRVRHVMRNKFSQTPYDPAGIISGLVYREQQYADYMKNKDDIPKNGNGKIWENILTLSENLPMPFWNGIHPRISKNLVEHLDDPKNPFWDTPMMDNVVKTKKTRIISMEPKISKYKTQPQLDFFEKHLPKGSLSTIFITRGSETLWGRVPLANAFAKHPHQMSLPPFAKKLVKGINTLLLTTNESETVPSEWKRPFPVHTDHQSSTMAWMNLHQVGHCMVIPTCWEYIDRNYYLITPQELLRLTEMRLKALNEWFLRYYGFNRAEVKPDSTTYLYEIKIIENALYVLNQANTKTTNTDGDKEKLLWFRGLHIKEIAKQMNVSEEQIWKGVFAMDKYLIDNHHSKPTEAVYNSAVQSTDVGTHPVEEIVVDVVAKARLDILPEEYGYWKEYTQMVFNIWKKWEDKE